MSERVGREKREVLRKAGGCWGSGNRHLYTVPGKAGPSQLLTPGSPPGFVTPGPVQLPAPDYSARGRCAARSSHPALGVWGREKTHTKAGGGDSGWAAAIGSCSRSPRGLQGLGPGGFVWLRPRAVSQPVEDSLPHGDGLGRAIPGALSGCGRGDPARLAVGRRAGSWPGSAWLPV